jgi:PIN domain nuclease of toxin-antitoxin system
LGAYLKLLLDTHALIWWWQGDSRLSAAAHAAISDERNDVAVSAASVWEIATKHRIGKLSEAHGILLQFNQAMLADNFIHLAVDWRHSLLAGQFEHKHADLFDRILAAQSHIESMVLVTKDEALAAFGIPTLW